MMTEVTKDMMPSYMFRHFNKAINKKRKSVGYLVERGYEFYVCEDIHSEIRGGTRYDGSSIITFKGIRIRMSTTRPHRECHLGCYRHDNESGIKFAVPPLKNPPRSAERPGWGEAQKDYIRKSQRHWILRLLDNIKWLCTIRLDFNGWSWCDIVYIDRDTYFEKVKAKPKRKTNGEKMATLAELFEGYEDHINKWAKTDTEYLINHDAISNMNAKRRYEEAENR